MKRKLWICLAAALTTAAAVAPASARGDSAAAVLACLPVRSFCVNKPPPTEQCCGGLFCNGPVNGGGVCTPF